METHIVYLCGQPAVNCLDRHVATCPDKVALIWERDEPGSEVKVTYRSASWKLCVSCYCVFVLLWASLFPLYRELLEMTCRLGNLLRRHGVKREDCVTIYMPPCPMAVASMLACARIGAAHNVVFAGFSAEALSERIRDGETVSKYRFIEFYFRLLTKVKKDCLL